jgi:uncharacterized protein YwgA/O-acetyl-ADP-ribose deacetylase (regulator of RNase III)
MSVQVLIGDMFSSSAQTLVNTVNTVGVMGKGVALEFRRRFPEMYRDYLVRCRNHQVHLGEPYLFKGSRPWVLNFPTKDHWRSVSRLTDIVRGLEYLERHYLQWGIESLAVPPLGAGQGQLEWKVVGPTLFRFLSHLSIPVELYAPYGTPHEELEPLFLERPLFDMADYSVERIGPAWVALVAILDRIYHEPYHWPVGRTTFQKVAYFATVSGIPTTLEFERGKYGPFASDLKRWLTRLTNNGLIHEVRLGQMFAIRPGPTYRDARRAYESRMEPWRPIVHRVADLFLRIRTTSQAELAATVHFSALRLAEQTDVATEADVLADVLAWKPAWSPEQIAFTIRTLAVLGWLRLRPSAELPVDERTLMGA